MSEQQQRARITTVLLAGFVVAAVLAVALTLSFAGQGDPFTRAEFRQWWSGLSASEQVDICLSVHSQGARAVAGLFIAVYEGPHLDVDTFARELDRAC